MPANVQIVQFVMTGEYIVVITGRDETIQLKFSRSTSYSTDAENHMRWVISNHLRTLRAKEAKLDAVTAKLMS